MVTRAAPRPAAAPRDGRPARRGRVRRLLAAVAVAALLGPLGVLWYSSLVPDTYSVMDMGVPDLGGGAAHHDHGGMTMAGVDTLVEPDTRPAEVRLTLTARREPFRLASGQVVDGYTLNGTSPGPEIRAVAGQIVEVRVVNESVPDGVTLHWHGMDVPNAEDGVAGVTQDAVPPGGSHTYRFRADQVGTYWYHSHQVSHVQVERGLFGALVVDPPGAPTPGIDALALVHHYDGVRTVNGRSGDLPVPAPPGATVRVRVVNTDNGPMPVWVDGAPFRLRAVDGADVNGPPEVADTAVRVTAGGRADLEVVVPPGGARVELGGSTAVVLGPASTPARPRPSRDLDLLTYGVPAAPGFDPAAADRSFEYRIGRWPGFLDGVPGLWWTVNGRLFPDVPMFVVRRGDVVRMHIANSSGEVHPMHLHGHHAVVLARNGVPSTGSPWWVDSLDVADGEDYDVAFVADNPGIWMDHCHNLPHAAEGLTAHLMYEGVDTPYRVGGAPVNHPE